LGAGEAISFVESWPSVDVVDFAVELVLRPLLDTDSCISRLIIGVVLDVRETKSASATRRPAWSRDGRDSI
jgi:hypothetical protein